MSRRNRLVESVEGLQQVVPIRKEDGLTWFEENLVDLVGHGSIHGEESTIPVPRHTAGCKAGGAERWNRFLKKRMVEQKGFEPSTPTLRTWCSPS